MPPGRSRGRGGLSVTYPCPSACRPYAEPGTTITNINDSIQTAAKVPAGERGILALIPPSLAVVADHPRTLPRRDRPTQFGRPRSANGSTGSQRTISDKMRGMDESGPRKVTPPRLLGWMPRCSPGTNDDEASIDGQRRSKRAVMFMGLRGTANRFAQTEGAL